MELKDITGAELFEASDTELQGLADGSIEATWTTRQLAMQELDVRAAEREKAADPPEFRAFKVGARRLHEAGKIGAARRKLVGSHIADPEILEAAALIDAWLDRQPAELREYALAKPQPRTVTIRETAAV